MALAQTCGLQFSHSSYVLEVSESFLAHSGLKVGASEDFRGKTRKPRWSVQSWGGTSCSEVFSHLSAACGLIRSFKDTFFSGEEAVEGRWGAVTTEGGW